MEPRPTRTQELFRHRIDLSTRAGLEELARARAASEYQTQHLIDTLRADRPAPQKKSAPPIVLPNTETLAWRAYLQGGPTD